MTFHATWDLFCRVIDNHGDLGVALRLARQLETAGQHIRLWVDDASALRWMAPDLHAQAHTPSMPSSLQVLPWDDANAVHLLHTLTPSQVWVELFGCELPEAFVQHGVTLRQDQALPPPVWLNLEYLSAEDYVARSHRLPSHIFSGPASGWKKWFFYPGFTPETGGLLQSHITSDVRSTPTPLNAGRDSSAKAASEAPSSCKASACALRTTLFCYEPPALSPWLRDMGQSPEAVPLHWRVMPGRPAQAFATATQALGGLPATMQATPLAHMSQPEFDAELAAADLNFVRGEDSLVSALRAGKPLVWHIYPQDDDAHHDKLQAFLDWLQAPPSLVAMHHAWNGITNTPAPVLTAAMLAEWQACLTQAQAKLAAMPPLTEQLLQFVQTQITACHAEC